MTFQSVGICVSDYQQVGIAIIFKPPNDQGSAAGLFASGSHLRIDFAGTRSGVSTDDGDTQKPKSSETCQ